MVGQEQEGFGASQQRGFAVVGDERGLELADGGGDGGGDIPGVTGEREIRATHGEFELDEAAAVNGFAGDDGDAEFFFEAGGADVETGARSEVHHVQHQDNGAAQIENLMNEIEISFKVGGVDDAKDSVGG